MKVLISCTENPNIFIEVLDELELFIDKKVIFDEKKKFAGPPPVSKYCNPHNFFFTLNLDTSPLRFSELSLSPIVFRHPGQIPSKAPIRIFGSFTLLRYET
jgi:hypothetical protein